MACSFTFVHLVTILLCSVVHSSVQDGVVMAPWGKIQGVPETSPLDDLHVTRFEGIPYAKPPLGNLRFSKPEPSKGSNQSVYVADAVKPSCLQANSTLESEDCLYLDLYVPHVKNSTTSSLLPVMVFIHGGGFIFYTGVYKADTLLKEKVIVALVRYRLGAMGFLSTGDDVMKGNWGLWDQRMAIEWVKDNVASFGGDANSITIFGESAGAASVAFQLLAPGANHLFQRAILQSGTTTSTWAIARQPALHAHTLGKRLGCVLGSSSLDLAQCLRKVDGVLLQKEMFAMRQSTTGFQLAGDFMFVPVVDQEFVLDEPLKLIQDQRHLQSVGALDKDIIIGVNNDEGTLVTGNPNNGVPNPPYFGNFFAKDAIPYMVRQRYGYTTARVEGVAEDFYRQNVPYPSLNKYQVSNAFADLQFVIPAWEFMTALSGSGNGTGSRYFYYFDYCPSFSPYVCMGHGYDIAFEFYFTNVNFTSDDRRVSDTFISLLTTFAETGTPTAPNTPVWTQFSRDSTAYMKISSKPEVKQSFLPKRVELWTQTIPLLFEVPVLPTPFIG